AKPTATERREGARPASAGDARARGSVATAARVREGCAGRFEATWPRSPPMRSLLLERREVAEQLDLVAELDAVLLACAAASLLHQCDRVGGASTAGILDEVRVLWRDLCASAAVAFQSARLQHPACGQLVLGVLEDAAERAPVRGLRRLSPGVQLGHLRLDLCRLARIDAQLRFDDDLAVSQIR